MQSMTDWVFILPWSISLLLSVYFPTILPNRGNEYVWHSGKLVQSYEDMLAHLLGSLLG